MMHGPTNIKLLLDLTQHLKRPMEHPTV